MLSQDDSSSSGRNLSTETVASAWANAAARWPQLQAYSHRPKGGSLITHSRAEWYALVRQVAKSLINLGLGFQTTAAISSSTRYEWAAFATGAQLAGGVPIGVYHTCSPKETSYIIIHSEAKIVCIEDEKQYNKLVAEKDHLGHVQHIIIMEGNVTGDDRVLTWAAFLAKGESSDDTELDNRIQQLKPEHYATFIYTSGTTGPPKGVMLSHANVTWTSSLINSIVEPKEGHRIVSFLPLSHIAEQIFTLYLPLYAPTHVIFSEGIEKIIDNLKEFQPQIFFSPPRLWEKMYASLSSKVPPGVAPENLPPQVKEGMLTAIGLNKIDWAIVGAAPISADILRFYHALGLPVHEVYGQSEDTGPTSLNLKHRRKYGSAGPPVPGVEVRIAEDDEILVRGPNVFQGYFKDPKATEETLKDGWLHSGDLGRFDEDGFLFIIGRKKDIIITAGGKNITPINIENAIKSHPLIGDAVVVGDCRPYLTALVTLDVDAAAQVCKAKGIESYEELTKSSETIAAVEKHINEVVNKDLAQVETIKKFFILPRPFTLEKGEVTPTMKLKRAFVNKAYANEIDTLYNTA